MEVNEKASAAPAAAEAGQPIVAFKGFDANMQCRGFQFEVGKTYEHDGKVRVCESGFHACESPFDVWSYYGPHDSRFCSVELSGELSRHAEDSKIAATHIRITAELSLPQIITAGIDYLTTLCKEAFAVPSKGSDGNATRIGSSGYATRIGSSGNAARIGSSGYATRIGSSGDAAQIGSSGDAARIGSSGNAARIGSSGYAAQIGSSGYAARIASSGYAARIGSSGNAAQIGSSGNAAQIGSSGNAARIGSSGYDARISSSGDDSVIVVAGFGAMVSTGDGGAVSVAYHDGKRTRFAVGYVGENIKPLTWYSVNERGEFVEAAA